MGENKSKEQIETTTNQLKLDLKVAQGSYNSTTTSTLTQKYSEYNLDIHATIMHEALQDEATLLEAMIDEEGEDAQA